MPDDGTMRPDTAMVLAAGLGKRMRPITDRIPKPLVQIGGKAMIDHALDRVAEAGIGRAVVNVHYLADQIETHLAGRKLPTIAISDERERLLETAGGILKALPLIGNKPFLVFNSDSLWAERETARGGAANMQRLLAAWNPDAMDILLLLAERATSFGFEGHGDFFMDDEGFLTRRGEKAESPYVYAGVAILKPGLFVDLPEGPSSLNILFDRAQAQHRLAGLALRGEWLHVGTPDAIAPAEQRLAAARM